MNRCACGEIVRPSTGDIINGEAVCLSCIMVRVFPDPPMLTNKATNAWRMAGMPGGRVVQPYLAGQGAW